MREFGRFSDRPTSESHDAGHSLARQRLGPTIVGQDAVRKELLRLAPLYRDFRSEILAMASVDQTVFTQRLDSMVVGRKPVTQHIAGVFEVDTEGKISVFATTSTAKSWTRNSPDHMATTRT